MITFSLYRFYSTGIRLGMAIATSEPRGDFVGVFPSYWAWKLNPKLISQNYTTISEMNRLSSPNYSIGDFKNSYSVMRLCQAIGADKYNLYYNTTNCNIDRLNNLLKMPDFFDQFSKNIDIGSTVSLSTGRLDQPLYELMKNPHFIYKLYKKMILLAYPPPFLIPETELEQKGNSYRSLALSQNIVQDILNVLEIEHWTCKVVNAEKYNIAISASNWSLEHLNELLMIPNSNFYEELRKKREDINLTSEMKFLISSVEDQNKKILNRLLLEETYPYETPKMHRMWNYGPLTHFLTLPLINLDSYKSFFTVWLICCVIFLYFSIYLWYKMLALDSKLPSFIVLTILIFIWLNFAPLYEGFITGVIEIFELFLLTLFIYFLSKRKEILSGIFLGFAAMTKFLPFIFIPYFLLKKKYKLFMTSLITCGLLAVLAEFTLGWKGNVVFSRFKVPGRDQWDWFYLQSIPNLINRLYSENFGYGTHPTLIYPNAAKLTTYIVISSLILFSGFIFVRKRRSEAVDFEIAILSILMISIIQYSHYYYLVLLLIPFSLGLKYIFTTYQKWGKVNKYDILILGSSFFLVGVVVPMSILKKLFSCFSVEFLEFYLGFSLPAYGYLVLLGWFYVKYITSDKSKKCFINA